MISAKTFFLLAVLALSFTLILQSKQVNADNGHHGRRAPDGSYHSNYGAEKKEREEKVRQHSEQLHVNEESLSG
eukprot:Pgem_evm1s2136